jgi:hypothetical protein
MKTNKIILHHSASKDGNIKNWGQIRRYHINQRGWVNIGYHYGIELVDYDYEILVGRFENENGAHCPGQNSQALGICLVGNFQWHPVPLLQWHKALKLVRQLMANHNLKPEDVYGHREFKATACPGKNFDMDKFRNDL